MLQISPAAAQLLLISVARWWQGCTDLDTYCVPVHTKNHRESMSTEILISQRRFWALTLKKQYFFFSILVYTEWVSFFLMIDGLRPLNGERNGLSWRNLSAKWGIQLWKKRRRASQPERHLSHESQPRNCLLIFVVCCTIRNFGRITEIQEGYK
jgi:hypothetical protein